MDTAGLALVISLTVSSIEKKKNSFQAMLKKEQSQHLEKVAWNIPRLLICWDQFICSSRHCRSAVISLVLVEPDTKVCFTSQLYVSDSPNVSLTISTGARNNAMPKSREQKHPASPEIEVRATSENQRRRQEASFSMRFWKDRNEKEGCRISL